MTPIPAWKAGLQRQTRRVDALSLRERAVLFATIAACAVAAFDHFLLSPRMAEQKAMATTLRQHAREVDGLRAQLAPSRIDGPGVRLEQELRALVDQRQQLDQTLTRLRSGPAAGAQLPDVLERVLRQHDRLTLLRLATVKPAETVPQGPTRQAVQLILKGSYPDLTHYLAETEAALPGLRWADVAIGRQGGQAQLSATVLLSRSPT